MKKIKTLKGPADDFENDLNFNFDDVNFGTTSEKDRGPAKPIMTGIKNAALGHAKSEQTIRRLVNKAFPREYGEVFDRYTSTREDVKSALDSVKGTMREPVNEFAKAIERKVPQKYKKTRKFIDFVKEKTQGYSADRYDKAADETRAIEASLGKLFSAQDEARSYERRQDIERRNIEKTEELIRFQGHTAALNLIARSTDTMAKQTLGITQQWQKKSLELQYRTVFGIRDTNEQLRLLIAQNKTQLDQIRHNTGLPEAQKLHLSERFADNLKNRFVNQAYGQFDKGKDFFEAITKQFTSSIKDIATQVAGGLQMGNMALGMSDMDFDDDEDPIQKRKRQMAERITGGILSVGTGPLGDAAGKRIRGNKKVNRAVKRGASHLKNFLNNADSEMREFAMGGEWDEGGVKSVLRALAGMAAPERQNNTTLTTENGAQFLRNPAIFDGSVKRSITHVMPGYLARILQELQITRTGNTSVGLTSFDFDKGKFVSKRDIQNKLTEAFTKNERVTKPLDNFLNDVSQSTGTNLNNEQQAKVREVLLKNRLTGKAMTPATMTKRGFWENSAAKDEAEMLSKAFKTYFDSAETGKFSGTGKALRSRDRFLDAMTASQENFNDPRAIIQDMYLQGHGDILEEMGWIQTDKKGGIKINVDQIVRSNLGTSSQGDDATGFDPTQARTRKLGRRPTVAPSSSSSSLNWTEFNRVMGGQQASIDKLMDVRSSSSQDFGPVSSRLDKLIVLGETSIDILTRIADREYIAAASAGQQPTFTDSVKTKVGGAMDGIKEFGNSLRDKIKARFTSIEKEDPSNKNFLNRTIGENLSVYKRRLGIGLRKAQKGLGFGVKVAKQGIDKAGDIASESRLFGKRIFEDFKDGIPMFGDVYLNKEKIPRITAEGLKRGLYFDGEGNPIRNLAELTEAVSGVYNDAQELVMSHFELTRSYVKANGEIFAKVFADRAARFASRLGKGAGVLMGMANDARKRIQTVTGFGTRFALNLAREALMPPRDVYIVGEQTPRLLAHIMRLGGYLNMDGSVITRPTLIRGPVIDTKGEVLISQADLAKGLVDDQGKPFKTLVVKLAEGMRRRAADVLRVVQGAKAAGAKIVQAGKTFVTKGISGFGQSATAGFFDGIGGGQSVDLLTQIRDILDQRLPGESKAAFAPIAKTAVDLSDNGNNKPPAAPVAQARSAYSGGAGLGSLIGGAAGLAGKGLKAIGGLFKRKGKGGMLGGLLGGLTGGDSGDATQAVKESQEQTKKEIDGVRKENKSLFKHLTSAFSNAKERKTQAAGIAGAPMMGAAVKGDTDGDGLRDNSWQDLKNKQRNVNEHSNSLDDVQKAESFNTENTIDLIINKLTGAGGVLSKFLGGIGGLLGGFFGKGAFGKLGGLLKGGAKVAATVGGAAAGLLGKVGGRVLGGIGGKVAASAAGAGARWAGMRALGTGAMAAGGFLAKRVAIPALAGIATVLGSPVVATAITVGGAVWGLKSLYDMLGDKPKEKPTGAGNGNITAMRMAEYGVSVQDLGPFTTVSWLEDHLYPFTRVVDGKAQIDEKKIDAAEIVARFKLDLDDQEQMAKFHRWMENRFKPNFLKHAAAAKTINLASLKDVAKLKPSNELAFFKTVASVGEGYDELSNPFGSADNLFLNGEKVREVKRLVGKMLEEKAKQEAPAEAAAKSSSIAKGTSEVFKSMEIQSQKGAKAGEAAMDKAMQTMKEHNKSAAYNADKSDAASKLLSGSTTYATSKVAPLPSQTVPPLASIRYRLYGLGDVHSAKVASLIALEAQTQQYFTLNKDGSSVFSGDVNKIFEMTRALFGISREDAVTVGIWKTWFTNRFLPVFSIYYGQSCFYAGSKNIQDAAVALRADQQEAVANAMISIAGSVSKVTASPWPGYNLSTNTTSIEDFRTVLRERSERQLLQEEKVKPRATPSSMQAPKPPDEMIKTVYRPEPRATSVMNPPPPSLPEVPPDMEQDQKANSSAGGGDKLTQAKPADTKTKAPGVGSLNKAGGTIFNGAGADPYLRRVGGAALDGANPEAVKLFRGMVEEYGQITGKKIQLNSGYRTFEQQAAAYQRNPRNAARPGGSLHEFGLAFDINSADADALEKLGLMRKYGFTRPVGGETWHIEPAGIQANIAKFKKDPGAASQAVANSVGRGGGGVGKTKGGFAHGRRSTEHAVALFNAGETIVTSNREDSDGLRAPVAADTAAGSQGGYAGNVAQVAAESSKVQSLPDFEKGPKDNASTDLRNRGDNIAGPSKGTGGVGSYDSLDSGSSRGDIKKLVADAARQVGVDPHIAQTTVAVESGFKVKAAAGTSSAKGLYQFVDGTWNEMVRKHGKAYGIPPGTSPNDPRANAIMGALYLKQNMQRVSQAGMPQTAVNGYLMHFLGPGGGRDFMRMKDTDNAAAAMPSAARSNPNIFYDKGRPRTKAEIVALLENKLNKAATDFGIGGGSVMTVGTQAPAANDSSIMTVSDKPKAPTADTAPAAPTMQQAVYRPEPKAPVQQIAQAPMVMPPQVNRNMSRDVRDPEVGSMGQSQKALFDSINKSYSVQEKQLTVQTKILDLLEKMASKASEMPPAAKEPEAVKPPAVNRGEPRVRTLAEPVIDTRRRA